MARPNREYDQLLEWISTVVEPESLFDDYFSEGTLDPDSKLSSFKNDVWDKVKTRFDNDGAKEGKRQGVITAVKELLNEPTDLRGLSKSNINDSRFGENFKKAFDAKDYEKEMLSPFLKDVASPKVKLKDLPPLLQRDKEYTKNIKQVINDRIKELPVDWREGTRKRIDVNLRPSRDDLNLGDFSVTSGKGIVYKFSAESSDDFDKLGGIQNDMFPARTLEALGGKRVVSNPAVLSFTKQEIIDTGFVKDKYTGRLSGDEEGMAHQIEGELLDQLEGASNEEVLRNIDITQALTKSSFRRLRSVRNKLLKTF